MTKQEHKYAQVLRWIADGEEVQIRWRGTLAFSDASAERVLIEITDQDLPPESFRLATRTIRVNGVEVPAPESVAPSYESEYFVADPTAAEFTWCYSWEDAESDCMFLERGLVYLRKEDAIARAKAMLLTQE